MTTTILLKYIKKSINIKILKIRVYRNCAAIEVFLFSSQFWVF